MPAKRARKTAGTRRRTTPHSAAQTAEQASDNDLQEEPVGNVFDEMAQDSVVIVHRMDPIRKIPVLMYKLTQDEATGPELQRLSGGGKYQCREQVRDDAGRMIWGRHRTVYVAGVPREPEMPRSYGLTTASVGQRRGNGAPEVEVGTAAPTSRDAIIDAGLLQFFSSMQEHNRAMAEGYKAQANKTPMDWAPFAPVMIALVKALFSPKGDVTNPLEIATQIAALMKENTSATGQFKDMLETVSDVFDIKDRAAGPPADPLTALTGMLPRIIDVIADEQKANPGKPINEKAVQQRLAQQQKKPQRVNPPMWQKMLGRFRGLLLRWAKQGLEPEAAGESILNLLPPEYHGQLREFLGLENASTLVFQTLPDLREYEQWTNDTFGWLTDQFYPEEEPEGEGEEVETFETPEDAEGDVVDAEPVEENE